MKLRNYAEFGGRQVEAGALRNVLAYQGVRAPHTGEPFGEALLFGIGGGVGLGYFVYLMPGSASLFIATRITTQESGRPGFIGGICERLGIAAELQSSSSAPAAEKKLKVALDAGTPVVAWVDARSLPYSGTPGGYHTLVIYGLDEERDEVYVADRPAVPITMSRGELAGARQSGEVSKFQALLVRVEGQVGMDRLRDAVERGIAACREQMEEGFGPPNFRMNFGLRALEKWAGLLVDGKDKRGWPKMFPAGPELFEALLTTYDHIESRGAGGSAFRELYAEFLEEAAALLERPALNEAAGLFRESAARWGELSAALLPDEIQVFKEAGELAGRRRMVSEEEGAAAGTEVTAIGDRLEEIKMQMSGAFPLSGGEVVGLLAGVRERVLAVHEVETEAVAALGAGLSVAVR